MSSPAQHRSRLHPHDDAPDTAEQFARLASMPQGPERDALRDGLTRAWLPMAERLARRYRDRGETLEDLRQVAALGLVKAVDRYDPERGAFESYAVPIITGELKRHFRDHMWMLHVPRRIQELRNAVRTARAELQAAGGSEPTVAELAAHTGLTEDDVRAGAEALDSFRALSLDAGPTGCEGDGLSMGGALGEPDTAFDVVVDREAVKPALRSLPARDQRILYLRFFQDMTQNRIAAELGLSQMQVSRLISHACARLREQTMRESAAPVPEEVARLKRDLGLRGRIDEAAGVLMAVGGLSPAVGRTALRAVAAKTGIKLGDVARLVVNWAHTGRLAGDIREALELELARRSPMTRSAGPKTGSTAACDERGDHATR